MKRLPSLPFLYPEVATTFNPAKGLGERCNLCRRALGCSLSCKHIL